MKIESEKLLERKIREAVKAAGGWSIKLLSMHVKGLPDRLCLLPRGRLFFVEVKTTGKKLRPAQKVVKKKLEGLGFEVKVIDRSEQINSIK
jgi:hypothetical protein